MSTLAEDDSSNGAPKTAHKQSERPRRYAYFVGDTVSGFLAAGATPGIDGETINLGTGQTFPISHFVERILSLMNVKKRIGHDPKRIRPTKSEVLRLVSNNDKARRLLHWTPGTSIDEGLTLTINFVEANIGSYRATLYNI